MPTTMLLRLAVVPLRLVIVAEPFVVLPARLKVIGLRVCNTVGKADSWTTNPGPIEETVVAGEVGMPLLVLVATIPTTIPLVSRTVTVLLAVVQVPVVVNVVGSVKGVLVFPLLGPTASELPVKVRVAFEEIVICEELLTELTVAPDGIPWPYIAIPA
jgi:hypothetical protein